MIDITQQQQLNHRLWTLDRHTQNMTGVYVYERSTIPNPGQCFFPHNTIKTNYTKQLKGALLIIYRNLAFTRCLLLLSPIWDQTAVRHKTLKFGLLYSLIWNFLT